MVLRFHKYFIVDQYLNSLRDRFVLDEFIEIEWLAVDGKDVRYISLPRGHDLERLAPHEEDVRVVSVHASALGGRVHEAEHPGGSGAAPDDQELAKAIINDAQRAQKAAVAPVLPLHAHHKAGGLALERHSPVHEDVQRLIYDLSELNRRSHFIGIAAATTPLPGGGAVVELGWDVEGGVDELVAVVRGVGIGCRVFRDGLMVQKDSREI